MDEHHYSALTGDLIESKSLDPAQRSAVQRELLLCLQELDRDLGESLVRPLALTAGDEVQGLLRAPSQAVTIVQRLTDRLLAVSPDGPGILFGLGWGTLSTGDLAEARTVEHLDGTAFHASRSALSKAQRAGNWVVLEGFEEPSGTALNSLFELMGAIRAGWTPTQARTTRDLRELGKRIDVARHQGVSPSVVTESLQLSRFDAVARGEEAARRVLSQFDAPPGPASEG